MKNKLNLISLAILIFVMLSGFIYRPVYNFTGRERDLLMRLSVAEAGNQGVIGQALIMRVVLNRLEDGRYGDSIEEIIFAEGQFYDEGMPATPNDNAYIALRLIENGWDESYGALYFSAAGYNGPVPLFKYKAHYFSRKEVKLIECNTIILEEK